MSDRNQSTPEESDLLFAIAHAIRYRGRRVVLDLDHAVARLAAERVLEALRRSYILTAKPPERHRPGIISRPLDSHPTEKGV